MDYFSFAVVEAVLAGALAGLTGVLVVLRQRAFFTMALTHATFPGAVVAVMLGIAAPIGAAVAAVALIGVAALVGRVRSQGSATASGIMLTLGFALGSLGQSLAHGPVDVESMLTGSILATDGGQVALTAVVLALVAALWLLAGRRLVFDSFDRGGAAAAGLSPLGTEVLALAGIAATVVTIQPVVGAILGVALVVAPAAAARRLVGSVGGMLWLAPVLGAASGVAGLWVSRSFGVSAGGAITLVAALVFAATLLVPQHRGAGRAGGRERPAPARATVGAP